MAECALRGVYLEPGSVKELLVSQHIERARMQRILEVQLLAAAAFQAKDVDKAHERLLAYAFPEHELRKAIRAAHTTKIAESLEDIQFSFSVDENGRLSLEQKPSNGSNGNGK
jgi:hypothetical protein